MPESGDIIIFDYLIEDVELDHLGIVLANKQHIIITCEVKVNNCTGIFHRLKNDNSRGYVSL